MSCHRCQADPHPKMFGTPRTCAFNDAGEFQPNNWNCATIAALLSTASVAMLDGSDELLEAVYNSHDWHGGWIVLTRYKRRGCTSSAIHVGDFFPPQPVTLAIVERFIAGKDWYPEGLPDGEAQPASSTPTEDQSR